MIIIDRYIFNGFIKILIFCITFMWILYIIGDIFGFLDEILREHIPLSSLAQFYFYLSPFILTQIIPISCLISSVYLLGNLNRHNEITALRASGVSVWEVLKPLLVCGFIVSLVVFVINDRILPVAMRKANRIRYEKLDVGKRGKSQTIKIENVAIYGFGNRIIFARLFDIQKNVLNDVIIHQHDAKQDLILKISAKSMQWQRKRWVGKEVVIYRLNNRGEFIGEPTIAKEMAISINETPTDFVNRQWRPEYMSFMQLKRYLEIFATGGSRTTYRKFLVDLYYKLSFPFASLVLIVISAPLTLSKQRGAALLGMAKGIVVALLYIPVMAIFIAFGKGGTLPPALSAWLANIVFAILGIYLLNKN